VQKYIRKDPLSLLPLTLHTQIGCCKR